MKLIKSTEADSVQDMINLNDNELHQPPLSFSSSPLRPLLTDLPSVSIPVAGKVRISNKNSPAYDLVYGPPVHPSLSLSLSSLTQNSYMNSNSNTTTSSSSLSTYSAHVTTGIVHQLHMNPVELVKPVLLELKINTDTYTPAITDQDGNVPITNDFDNDLHNHNMDDNENDDDDDDGEILPFTPGTQTKMKGWTKQLYDDRPLSSFNLADKDEHEKDKGHLITSDHEYHPLHSEHDGDDDNRMIEFDKETFGRRNSLQALVERTGMMAARRRFSP